jgi:hypothetical protein
MRDQSQRRGVVRARTDAPIGCSAAEGLRQAAAHSFARKRVWECDEIFSFLEKQSVVAQWSHRSCERDFAAGNDVLERGRWLRVR